MQFSSAVQASAVLAFANAAALTSRSLSGEATFYGGNTAGGTCSFSGYTLPSGIYGTALTSSSWDDAANCGACVAVTGPSGTVITAMIVDECPSCGTNQLDLFSDAFAAIADPTTGVIDITWSYIDCPITSALSLTNKDGVSAYWFSMQVVNANKAVESLEVSTDGGGTWQTTTRQTYNFFEQSSGFGTTTVDIKVTSTDGDVVIVNDVNVSSGASVTASSNFGSGSSAVAATSSSVKALSTSSSSSSEAPQTTSTTSAVEIAAVSTTPIQSTSPLPASSSTQTAAPVLSTSSSVLSASSVPKTTSIPGANFAQTPSISSSYLSSTTSLSSSSSLSTSSHKSKCSSIYPNSTLSYSTIPSVTAQAAAGALTTTTSLASKTTASVASSVAGGNKTSAAASATSSAAAFTGGAERIGTGMWAAAFVGAAMCVL